MRASRTALHEQKKQQQREIRKAEYRKNRALLPWTGPGITMTIYGAEPPQKMKIKGFSRITYVPTSMFKDWSLGMYGWTVRTTGTVPNVI
jgi:hypothetical protein